MQKIELSIGDLTIARAEKLAQRYRLSLQSFLEFAVVRGIREIEKQVEQEERALRRAAAALVAEVEGGMQR